METSLPPPYASRFESIGAVAPEARLSSRDLMDRVRMWGKIDLGRLTGIRSRRTCREGEDSYTLSLDAARECLSYSSYAASDLEMIVCCSITRFKDGPTHVYEPPLSLYVKQALGATRALNFDISNACAGMMTGVSLLNSFIRQGKIRCGMVISGEWISSLGENAAPKVKTIFSEQLASLTVGDAGAAVILERSVPGQAELAVSDYVTMARWSHLCIGRLCPDAPGAEMDTQARKIHQVAIDALPTIVDRALAKSGLDYGALDHLLPHQTSVRAIYSGDKHLALHYGAHPKNIVMNLQEYGNTASTSHFLALYRFLKEKRFKPGETILMMALASGLVMGIVSFTMDALAERYTHEDPRG